ncbi:MAG TPA: VWA domain-containing protein [Bryobacteraceae bacterium]|jgi:VWFA-related protein|nr:VWA domain-containing protein [Bryobacteraceae bacterium]
MTTSFLASICLSLASLAALAQQETPPAAAPEPRITLDVVANDKSGKAVPGLQQQDFTILDNKQPQKILSFEAVGAANGSGVPLEIILIVDAVNTTFRSVAYERGQLEQFLRRDGGRLAWPVSIGFFTDSGLQLPGTAERDGNALVSYLDQHETGLRNVTRSQGFYGAADRTQLSIKALTQLAQYEQPKPGRKIVVWISPGWPLLTGPAVQLTSKTEQEIFDTIVGLSTELRQSRITLYSVDPLGTSDAGSFRTFYYAEFLKGVTLPKHAVFGDLGLQVFAIHSGGRVLNSSNDVSSEIETCIRDASAYDASAYYVLSFDANPADGPNEYHAIDVKIGQPQLKAQTQTGYYAQPTIANRR